MPGSVVTWEDWEEFCFTEDFLGVWDLCSEWADDVETLQQRVARAGLSGWEPISPIFRNKYKARFEQRLKRKKTNWNQL